MPLLVDEHKNAHTADDDIAQKAVDIRQLPENHPAQQCGKDHLSIVIDRDFLGGGEAIGTGDGKLTGAAEGSGSQQTDELERGHGRTHRNEIGQAHQTGERREHKYDQRGMHALLTHQTHKGIGNAGTKAAQQSDQRRHQRHIGGIGLDDQQTA